MRLPRDLSGNDGAKALAEFDCGRVWEAEATPEKDLAELIREGRSIECHGAKGSEALLWEIEA
ncbi:MAG: hypothetical protein AAB409_08770 [Gemmatimonadota bacterium]